MIAKVFRQAGAKLWCYVAHRRFWHWREFVGWWYCGECGEIWLP
jgi:ribosomal protein L37AE/L43A